jgi:hypothetical protein
MDCSSSKDGTDQLLFGQITLDKLLKYELRICGGGKTLQTEIRNCVLHGLTAEKAFRNRYGFRCRRSRHLHLKVYHIEPPKIQVLITLGTHATH